MRWGVGKGKFRNVTAIILCVILAAMFYIVWTFFNAIKPLTVDTSPLAQTASVKDRLLNHGSGTTTTLTLSNLLLFNSIADSVQHIFNTGFPDTHTKTASFSKKAMQERLVDVQTQTRRTLALMLNKTYTPIEEYRLNEAKILHVIAKPDSASLTNSQLALLSQPEIRIASRRVRELCDSVQVTPVEYSLIEEFKYRLRGKLTPFRIALTSDEISYARMLDSAPATGAKK